MECALRNILQATKHDSDLIFCGYNHDTSSYFNNMMYYNGEITSMSFISVGVVLE